MKRIRYLLFLRDVFYLSLTAVGGPNAHLATMIDLLIRKRAYATEDEFFELQALCQMLPGPTSTQTIVALAYKLAGAKLAYITLIIWCLPAVSIMIAAAFLFKYLPPSSNHFVEYVIPVAVGLVAYSSYTIANKVVYSNIGVIMMVVVAIASYLYRSPWLNPILILLGGLITSFDYKKIGPQEHKGPFKIEWANFVLFVGVFVVTLVLGAVTNWHLVKIFQNFYRSGSLVFGGGQVLIPMLYTEFVELERKACMTGSEFLAGYAFTQAVPGPVFSFCSYIGVFAMKNNPIYLQIMGGLVAAAGIFLPGTFLIFFIVKFWTQLKVYRPIKASLEGILAVSAGLVIASAMVFLSSIQSDLFFNYFIVAVTVALMATQKVSPALLVIAAFALGLVF